MAAEFDERIIAAALAAALNTALAPHAVFEFGEVPGADENPGVLPDIYVVSALERRFVQSGRAVGRTDRTGWRIQLRYVGRDVAEARWCVPRIATALNGKTITVSGTESTPITHETSQAVGPDSGRFSGLVEYTFAL